MRLRDSALRGRAGASRWSGPLAVGTAVMGTLVLVLALSLWVGRAPGWGFDFQAYYEAAERLARTGTPYRADTLSGPFAPTTAGLYLYSPVLAAALLPVTSLAPDAATLGWLGLKLAALAVTCALLPAHALVRLAVFGIAGMSWPVLHDLNLGNVSLIVTFLSVVAWRGLDGPLSAVSIALSIALRPTMGLVAVWWLLRAAWHPLAITVATGVGLVVVTLPVVGVGGWLDYATLLRNVGDITGAPANVDLASAVTRLGAPAWAASLAMIAGYASAALAVVLSLRRDRELSFVVTIGATLLVTPLLWDHYMTQILIPAAFLAARGRPWGLALPLLAWLPPDLLPFVALTALWLPFLASDTSRRPALAANAQARA